MVFNYPDHKLVSVTLIILKFQTLWFPNEARYWTAKLQQIQIYHLISMPDKNKNFGESLGLDFRKWSSHVKTIYRMSSDLLRRKNIFDLMRKKLHFQVTTVGDSFCKIQTCHGYKTECANGLDKKGRQTSLRKNDQHFEFSKTFLDRSSIMFSCKCSLQCEFEFLSILQFELTLIYCRQHFRLPLNVTTILSTSNRKMYTQTVFEKKNANLNA